MSTAPRNIAIEALRLVAMAIVTAQHAIGLIAGYEATEILPGVTLGQFGVAIFCVIAGQYAMTGTAPPRRWLQQRLVRLYPMLWLVLPVAFAAAIAMGRPVGLGQFVSQMLGTGYFTHGFDLVDGPTWFVSLLLLCYAITFVARWLRQPSLVFVLAALAALLLLCLRVEVALSRHVLGFAVAALFAVFLPRQGPALLAVSLLFLFAGAMRPTFVLPAFALAALAMALWVPRGRAPAIEAASAYVYPYFLVHGPILVAATSFLPPLPALVVALPAAAVASVLLDRVAGFLVPKRGADSARSCATSACSVTMSRRIHTLVSRRPSAGACQIRCQCSSSRRICATCVTCAHSCCCNDAASTITGTR